MLINSGFHFKNLQYECLLDSNNKDSILIHDTGSYILIYPSALRNVPIAFEFGKLSVTSPDDLINFFNKYGILFSESISYKERTLDYSEFLSFKENRDLIIYTRKVLELKQAIDENNYIKMLLCCIYFIFHKEESYDDYLLPMFNTNALNYHYNEFLNDPDISYKTLSESISLYAQYIQTPYCDESKNEIDLFNSLFDIVNTIKLQYIDNKGTINIDNTTKINIDQINYNKILVIAKNVLTDIINEEIFSIHPELSYCANSLHPDWKVNSLWECMYLELFLEFSKDNFIKQCPCCESFFTVPSSNTRKIYCSARCSGLMAKRMQRERERVKKSKVNSLSKKEH